MVVEHRRKINDSGIIRNTKYNKCIKSEMINHKQESYQIEKKYSYFHEINPLNKN